MARLRGDNQPWISFPDFGMTNRPCFAVVLLFSVVMLVLSGCRPKPQLTAQEEEGKHLYNVRCAHCHEENDLNLKKVPPNLHTLFSRPALPSGAPANDSDVRRVVLTGKGLMPSFAGRFSGDQMAALLSYLHTGLR
jgi:mono/diheme cytochrome c family protein